MQKWEYLALACYVFDWHDSRGLSGAFDRFDKDNIPNPGPVLNALGAEGWELTGTVAEWMSDYGTLLVFKRPLS